MNPGAPEKAPDAGAFFLLAYPILRVENEAEMKRDMKCSI
jgi:hypothetical protein